MAALQHFPPDTRVFVRGYEFGLSDPEVSGVYDVDLGAFVDNDVDNDRSTFGPHALKGEGWYAPKGEAKGIVLDR